MKKSLKIILISLSVVIMIIVLDTLQAKLWNNSPILKIRENLKGGSTGTIDYVDKGILVDTFYYLNGKKITLFKWENRLFSDEKEVNISLGKKEGTFKDFNEYLTLEDRKIYLADNIKEVYVTYGEKVSLREFVLNNKDEFIKILMDNLEYNNGLNDGGTTIYKAKDKDVTLINCHTLKGNNDVYIGDYYIEYIEDMCE